MGLQSCTCFYSSNILAWDPISVALECSGVYFSSSIQQVEPICAVSRSGVAENVNIPLFVSQEL